MQADWQPSCFMSFAYCIFLNLYHSLGLFSRWWIWWYLVLFSQKTGFDISCKLSPLETICMTCQNLFSENNISMFICWKLYPEWGRPRSVSQLDAPSDWRPGIRGFNPRWGQQHSFMEIDHEIFSTVILFLSLIQEGHLSVSGERMCSILVNHLED